MPQWWKVNIKVQSSKVQFNMKQYLMSDLYLLVNVSIKQYLYSKEIINFVFYSNTKQSCQEEHATCNLILCCHKI